MSSIKVLKTLDMGKGVTMDVCIDESEPEDSIERYFSEVKSTGEEALSVPPHWHKYHSEHMRIIEGRARITCNGVTVEVKAGDPDFFIPRRAVHSIEGFKGEKLVAQERPDPPGMYKAMFFNDLLSTGEMSGFWRTMRIFWDGDAYPAMPFYFRFLDEAFLFVFGGIAKLTMAPRPKEL
jgi:mannose-6-phosphate isomerase-like protein (cupin superfamily)